MSMKITKAIVAVAGSGTRFLPVTKSIPKELLPIVDKPIIQLVVEELAAAGIKDIILVTKHKKNLFQDYFSQNKILENELSQAGKNEILKKVRKITNLANFIFVKQVGPYGNGAPVLSAASLVDGEPFIYVWGDDLVKSKVSFTKQMIDDYNKTGHLMIGIQAVPCSQVDRYGIVKLKPGTRQIEDIIEKPPVKEAPSALADFGRMILNQEIIDILKNIPLGKGNELWIVDAIRQYVRSGGEFYAKKVKDGQWLTTGDPINYLKTILEYATDRKEFKKII